MRVLYALVGCGLRELNLIYPVSNLLLLYFFGGCKVYRMYYALFRGGWNTANLIESSLTTSSQKWAEIFWHKFSVVGPHRSFLHSQIARYTYLFGMVQKDHTSSRWFDWISSSLNASLQAIEGVRVLYAIVGWCSKALNLIDPVANYLQLYLFSGYKVCWVHYALVRGGSSTVNLIEPSRTTSSLKYVKMKCFFTWVRGGWTVLNLLQLILFRG